MSEGKKKHIRLDFAPGVRLAFTGTEVSADAGVLLLREFDERLGLTDALAEKLVDPRYPAFTKHTLRDLLRQYLYQIIQGYADADDADSLRIDPALRLAVGKERFEEPLASQPTLTRLENMILARPTNLRVLREANLEWVETARKLRDQKKFVIDLDSFEDPVHGRQSRSAYNGYYEHRIFLPLVALDGETGDVLAAELRGGTDYDIDPIMDLVCPLIHHERVRRRPLRVRADAEFARPELMERFEQYTGLRYYIRIKSNAVLEAQIEAFKTPPPGRPPENDPIVQHTSFHYQAETWPHPRRILAKIEHWPEELFPRTGFIVTNDEACTPEDGIRFYNGRGRAEHIIEEGKNALSWDRLSCHKFRANRARLAVHVLAYTLAHLMREFGMPRSHEHWKIRTIREKLLKLATRVTRGARMVFFHLAASFPQKLLFLRVMKNLQRLPVLDTS